MNGWNTKDFQGTENTPCYPNSGPTASHLSKGRERTTQSVKCTNHEMGAVRSLEFIHRYGRHSSGGDVDGGEAVHVWGQRVDEKFLYFPLNFAVNQKLLFF